MENKDNSEAEQGHKPAHLGDAKGPKITETMTKLSKKDVRKTISASNQWDKVIDDWKLSGKIVLVHDGKIGFSEENGSVTTEGDVELIGRVHWTDADEKFGTWRWGHTLDKWEDRTTAKSEYKYPFANSPVIAAEDVVIFTIIRAAAEKHKYQLVQLIRMGPDEMDKYAFGIKNLRHCTHESSAASIIPSSTVAQFAAAIDAHSTEGNPQIGLGVVKIQ